MKRVVVTGATGKAGRAVVRELLDHGYEVRATDIAASREDGALRADLTDFGQTIECLHGVEAVVHLANIRAPNIFTPETTFNHNVVMNFNVFRAATMLGLHRVVWASSEMTLGLPFGSDLTEAPYLETESLTPRYAPVDEDHYPLPTNTYALAKVASETIAAHFAQWSGIPFVALRLSNLLLTEDYPKLPDLWPDPRNRRFNLWGYVDTRDVGAAFRLALEAPAEAVRGSSSFLISAADTVMDRPSSDLMAAVFPEVPLTREIGKFETLLSIERARRVLGYEPHHSWRDHLER